MSSRYTIICLTHDPAINEADADWGSAEEAVGAVNLGTGVVSAHKNCDIVIGRWSYPLIEVACLGPNSDHEGCYHHDPRWLDVGWLRLLWHARKRHPGEVSAWVGTSARCWPADRLDSLATLFIDEVS